MFKLLTAIVLMIAISGCSTVDYPEQPSHIKEVTLEDGRVVLMYVTGYSIEDFKCEFEFKEVGCRN